MTGRTIIGVVGTGTASAEVARVAEEVGRLAAEAGATIVCGGLGGVMDAACRGASEAGGLTIGILPGEDASEASPWVQIPIVTGLRQARNIVIARTAHALIAIDGRFGTLSEIAYGLHFGVPVVTLGSFSLHHTDPAFIDPTHAVATPRRAVDLALELAEGR